MLPCTAGKLFLLSTDFLFAKNVFSQNMWWHKNKFPSFLNLIFKDFTRSLHRLSFPIQVRMWLRSQELLLSPGAVGIAHLMLENRSGNFSTQTHLAVCVKQQFVRKDYIFFSCSWIWRWLKFWKRSTEVPYLIFDVVDRKEMSTAVCQGQYSLSLGRSAGFSPGQTIKETNLPIPRVVFC